MVSTLKMKYQAQWNMLVMVNTKKLLGVISCFVYAFKMAMAIASLCLALWAGFKIFYAFKLAVAIAFFCVDAVEAI